jgi:hypothetical protein
MFRVQRFIAHSHCTSRYNCIRCRDDRDTFRRDFGAPDLCPFGITAGTAAAVRAAAIDASTPLKPLKALKPGKPSTALKPLEPSTALKPLKLLKALRPGKALKTGETEPARPIKAGGEIARTGPFIFFHYRLAAPIIRWLQDHPDDRAAIDCALAAVAIFGLVLCGPIVPILCIGASLILGWLTTLDLARCGCASRAARWDAALRRLY